MSWAGLVSPRRAAVWAGIGCGLLTFADLVAFLQHRVHTRPGAWFWVLLSGGYAVLAAMEWHLSKGISAGRWTKAELRPLRSGPEGRWCVMLHGTALLMLVFTVWWAVMTDDSAFFPLVMVAILYPSRLQGVLRRMYAEGGAAKFDELRADPIPALGRTRDRGEP